LYRAKIERRLDTIADSVACAEKANLTAS